MKILIVKKDEKINIEDLGNAEYALQQVDDDNYKIIKARSGKFGLVNLKKFLTELGALNH